jgi:hypothetical protein
VEKYIFFSPQNIEFYSILHFWVIQEMYSVYGSVLRNKSELWQLLYSVQKFEMGAVVPKYVSKLKYDRDVKVIC